MSQVDLSRYDGSDPQLPKRVAILGYVFEPRPDAAWAHFARSHAGSDTTGRMASLLHGGSPNPTSDIGRSPYPLVSALPQATQDYLWMWWDHYWELAGGNLVGYLSEFLQQQDSGESEWSLPL